MDETRLKALVSELNQIVPEEGAMVSFRQYGGGPDESMIVGTRAGLLRAGVELLRAGIAPTGEQPDQRDLKALRTITHAESEYYFDHFEEKQLPEDMSPYEHDARIAKRLGFGLLICFILLVALAGYGFVRLFV